MESAGERHEGTMLLCYDGSPEAMEMIDVVARLIPASSAVVATVWKPVREDVLSGPHESPPVSDPQEARRRQHQWAIAAARAGVEHAAAAGLQARPVVVEAHGPVWLAIDEAAEEFEARLIACGTKRSGVTSALPLNLASALTQNARHPVLVVPSSKATAERVRAIEKEHGIPARR